MATVARNPDESAPAGSGTPSQEPEPSRPGQEERALERLARAIVPSSLGDIGFEIPWRQRRSSKLFAMIGVVTLGIVASFFVAEIVVQRHLLSQAVLESDLLSHTMNNALHRAMLQDRRGDAYLIMQDIA